MISTASILKSLTAYFKNEGWSVTHFYIYRPSLIESFGVGDRRNTRSDKTGNVFLPEPHLCFVKRRLGLLFEVDYKYSKTAIANILRIRNTAEKDFYLKKYFQGTIPKKLFYGFALPNTPVQVERVKKHVEDLDFVACISRRGELSFLKSAPPNALFNLKLQI